MYVFAQKGKFFQRKNLVLTNRSVRMVYKIKTLKYFSFEKFNKIESDESCYII